MAVNTSKLYHQRYLTDAQALNQRLCEGFARYRDDVQTRKSHFFHGRYENVYISPSQIPELAALYRHAIDFARDILQWDSQRKLRCGGWFNCMAKGHSTTKHRHDDDDELLSAVYYLQVPPQSGDLRLYSSQGIVRVQPEEGMFVFFGPHVEHEVTENHSDHERLSIGMNIGPVHGD